MILVKIVEEKKRKKFNLSKEINAETQRPQRVLIANSADETSYALP